MKQLLVPWTSHELHNHLISSKELLSMLIWTARFRLTYLQISPSVPLTGISVHSPLSIAHCCPAPQQLSISSFVEPV